MDLAKALKLLKNIANLLATQFKKADSVVGNKEMKEAVKGTMAVSALLAKHFQDGVQVLDFVAMWKQWGSDPALQAAVKAAYEDANKIPAEYQDLDLGEGLELGAEALDGVPALLYALKKPAPPDQAA